MARVLIVSHDLVGSSMAGPGIRYWEVSRALARRGIAVELAAPDGSAFPAAPFPTHTYRLDDRHLIDLARAADAVMVTGPLLEQLPDLKGVLGALVVDLYDPFLYENLHRRVPLDQHEGGVRTLAEQARCGDYFVCASERQRDNYLGMLAAWGRVNPTTYAADPTLRSLIDLLPFGIPGEPPRTGPAARGAIDGIAPGDELVVWNGGLWDWFDPLTAVRAVAQLAPARPRLRLLFLGTRHPNPAIGEPAAARQARALAAELGLLDRHVFFRDWTPYEARGAFLLEANAAISLHVEGVETRYAYRTRLLDCIWAGLPVVVSSGDQIGDELAAQGLALAAPVGDVDAVAAALARLLGEPHARAVRARAFAAVAEAMSWDGAAEPLARFLERPRKAADRQPAAMPVEAQPLPQQDALTLPSPRGRGEAGGTPRRIWARVLRR